MAVYWLQNDQLVFPHPMLAESNGLLAVGGDLSPDRLLLAYRNGIFPWFEENGVFYWYSPHPRWVLFPGELKVQKSMRSIFNQGKFRFTIDTAFEQVMQACAESPRDGQFGTWITRAFFEGYGALFDRGIAHSVEVWEEEKLVAGLYGVSLGKIFFGESMFTRVNNGSKAGFIALVRALLLRGFWLVDCQQHTGHLERLGSRGISRDLFLEYLHRNQFEKTLVGHWAFDNRGYLEVEEASEGNFNNSQK